MPLGTGAERCCSKHFRDGTLGEALEVAGQFGDLSSQAMSETARAALIEMPVDTVKGLIDLASIAAGALTGDEQSILQMGMIADHMLALVTDPVGTIETEIAAELMRADALEAQGNLEEANKIRSKVFMSGAWAVAGIPGAVSATSAGIKVAVKSSGSVKIGEFIVGEGGSLKLPGGVTNSVAGNIATAKRLADDLRLASARSPFTPDGKLTPSAIAQGDEIIPAGSLVNPNIPAGFSKYESPTFHSPSGDFKLHYYYNPTTNQVIYDLDYKVIFNHQGNWP